MQLFQQQLVKEINRLYHEEEAVVYDAAHPEIFEKERSTWERLAKFLPKNSDGIKILDIGSGTGFVFEALSSHLVSSDTFVFSDISPAMLEKSKIKFAGCVVPRLDFIVTDAEQLPFLDAQFDVVTMNSVLHHIPNTLRLAGEIRRVLKKGGRAFIVHEPNRAFFTDRLMRYSQAIAGTIQAGILRLKRIFFRDAYRTASSKAAYAHIYAKVNQELRSRGSISTDLKAEEIQSLVDVYSPTATGQADPEKGFTKFELLHTFFKGFKEVYWETHAHLGKIDPNLFPVFIVVEALLRRMRPDAGSSFSLVTEKTS